jgi:hypothetical protein
MRLSPAALALAGLLSLSAAPAFAGAAETAFLNKFAGQWTGGGQVTGEHAGPLDCKLTIRPVTAGLNFRGSCNMEGMTMQSFSGVLAYNTASKHYEASSPNNDDVAVGTKKGNSLVFVTKLRNIAGSGNSTMTLTSSRIAIDFVLAASQSGKTSKAHLEFKK